jgi:hypothetical protein
MMYTCGDLLTEPMGFSPKSSMFRLIRIGYYCTSSMPQYELFINKEHVLTVISPCFLTLPCPHRRGTEYGDDNLGRSVTLVGAFAKMVVYLPSVEESLISFISEVGPSSRI